MSVHHSFAEIGYAFRDAMADAGLITDDDIYPTGKIERFHVDGDKLGKRNGWYVIYAGRVASGAFGCWKRDISQSWCEARLKELPTKDRAIATNQIRAAKEQAGLEREDRARGAAETAARMWCKAAVPWPDFPYLATKRVGAYGIRQLDKHLLVPLWGRDRRLHSLQTIDAFGKKLFLADGKTGGMFHVLGDIEASKRCWIAEGYATAASVHAVMREPCVVAFNCQNLPKVARLMKDMWWSKEWLAMADDDHKTEGNPGVSAAQSALDRGWLSAYELPAFTEDEKTAGLTDFNDLCVARGLS